MRVYISSDIEGVAGVVNREHTNPNGFEYESARRWMTGELLAILAEFRSAGAKEFVISDSHGNGLSLMYDELPADTRLIRSWPRPLLMMEGVDQGTFDAAVLHGYHSSASSIDGGFCHTLSTAAIAGLIINGQEMSEASISTYVAGHFGVPVVMVSGDDAAINELRHFPGAPETVVTKRSLGYRSADCPSHAASCQSLAECARRAVLRLDRFEPQVLDGPLVLEIDLRYRLPAEVLAYLAGVSRVGPRRVRYTARDIVEISRLLAFILFFSCTAE